MARPTRIEREKRGRFLRDESPIGKKKKPKDCFDSTRNILVRFFFLEKDSLLLYFSTTFLALRVKWPFLKRKKEDAKMRFLCKSQLCALWNLAASSLDLLRC